jgi:cytochrome d ubiquinol oxidase subunit II
MPALQEDPKMPLNEIWFVLFVIVITGYLILDGFDLGVGILHRIVAQTDKERRISLNSIGPIWDGNEVWLVLGGGVLFAAFPIVYASLLSGFYAAIMLLLLFLILRTVAIEFRSKREGAGWRNAWDLIFFLSSLTLALLLGVAFGNIIRGVPLDQQGNITINSLFDLLHPFALWIGVMTIVMLALHGGIYLNLKTEGLLQARVQMFLKPLMLVFAVMSVFTLVFFFLFNLQVAAVYSRIWPLIFPVVAAVAFGGVWYFLRQGKEFYAFVSSSVMIAFSMFTVAVGLFPNLLLSTTNPDYSLTIYNSASQANTLTVMLVIALIGMPFVLLYTAGVYYIFRGKVRLAPDSY